LLVINLIPCGISGSGIALKKGGVLGVASAVAEPADFGEKLWESTDTGEEEAMRGVEVTIGGERFQTGHTLIGATPLKILFNVRATGTASGTAELKLINSSGVEKASFGTIDMSELTSSFSTETFENASNTETIANNDKIVFYYDGNCCFRFQTCATCSESGTNESFYSVVSSAWTDRTTVCTMTVYGNPA